jgi:23S rRNA pseudouridine1911/1915/1917 synthase
VSAEQGELGDDGSEQLSVSVPALMDGMRVDRALSMLTGCSRSEATRLIEDRAVTVDGEIVAKPSVQLSEGGLLEALLPAAGDGAVAPDPSVAVDVVSVHEDFVIVNKGFSQVVHPGAGNEHGTLIAGVLARFPEIGALPGAGCGEVSRPGVIHRLDKGTSGLLAIATTPRGYASLTQQLAERTMERRYVGVVEGHVESRQGIVDAPIGRSTSTPTRMAVRPDGRPARTTYEVVAYLKDPDRTLVGLSLETGRTHQIRVHMAAIGHPIVNDPRYGQRNERRLDPGRLALHAGRLVLRDPSDGAVVRTVTAWPADLRLLGGAEDADSWLETA